jgi:hypothetical protein
LARPRVRVDQQRDGQRRRVHYARAISRLFDQLAHAQDGVCLVGERDAHAKAARLDRLDAGIDE